MTAAKKSMFNNEFRMGDYLIAVDEWNWSLYSVTPVKNKEAKSYGGENRLLHGHFSSVDRLVLKIGKLDALKESNKREIASLGAFIDVYNNKVLAAVEMLEKLPESAFRTIRGGPLSYANVKE